MERILAVGDRDAWPPQWTLAGLSVAFSRTLPSPVEAEEIDALVFLPGAAPLLGNTLDVLTDLRHDGSLAALLADKSSTPGVGAIMLEHGLDGFLDIAWPDALARACLLTATGHVQLGRNIVEIQRVVLEQARSESSALFNLAVRDDLTQLYNHRHFAAILAREHDRSARQKRHYALVYIDLDDLKRLNTRYGHEGGSAALRELAHELLLLLRSSDVAVRMGGDEFVVLLTDCDRRGGFEFAQRFCARLRAHVFVSGGQPMRITASCGAAAYPEDGDDCQRILDRADHALLVAKARGKDRAVACGDRAETEGSTP